MPGSGFIETDMTHALSDEVRKACNDTIPLRRGGKPEDVANVCVFLASGLIHTLPDKPFTCVVV
ncbi:hypothetical protein MASR1M31_17640 [Porphyromonadaceae bacterium]